MRRGTDEKAASRRARPRTQGQRPTTAAQQARFLEEYAVRGVITAAAEAAQIDRQRHYDWLNETHRWPDYAARFAAARERAVDRLEAEAIRRAVDGWDEPVFGSGGPGVGTVQVGVVRKYSDRMLELTLKGRRPNVYRERHSIELGGPGGAPIPVQNMTEAEAADLFQAKLKPR